MLPNRPTQDPPANFRANFFEQKARFIAYPYNSVLVPGSLQLSLHGGVRLFFERDPVEQCRQK